MPFAPGIWQGVQQVQAAQEKKRMDDSTLADQKAEREYKAFLTDRARSADARQAALDTRAQTEKDNSAKFLNEGLKAQLPPPPTPNFSPDLGKFMPPLEPPMLTQPQTPAPGQASVPMQRPMGPNVAPPARPQPQGIPPYRSVQAPPAAAAQPQAPITGVVVPPTKNEMQLFAERMQKQGVPETQWGARWTAEAPIRQELAASSKTHFDQEIKASKAESDMLRSTLAQIKQINDADPDSIKNKHIIALTKNALELGKSRAGGTGGGGSSGGLTPEALALSSDLATRGIKLPSVGGKAGGVQQTQMLNYLAKTGVTAQDIAQKSAEHGGLKSALNKLIPRGAGIDVSTAAIKGHISNLEEILDSTAAKGGASILNKPINAIRSALSSEDYARLNLAVKQVANEYERLIVGGTLSISQLHNGAREDAAKLLNGDMTVGQIRAIVPIMMKEIAASKKASDDTIAEVKGRIGGDSRKDTGGSSPKTNAKGWPLARNDSTGETAYIGPNGEMEKVK